MRTRSFFCNCNVQQRNEIIPEGTVPNERKALNTCESKDLLDSFDIGDLLDLDYQNVCN